VLLHRGYDVVLKETRLLRIGFERRWKSEQESAVTNANRS
jgi:hypothetical protein